MGGDVGPPLVGLMHMRLDLGGTDLLKESLEKVKFIQEKLLAAQSRKKEYADRKVRDLDYREGEQVLLKIAPIKGVI